MENLDLNYIVYLLKNTNNNNTYLGITNNSIRRLRQHNGDIKGGAKYTHNFKGNGIWVYHLQIQNLSKKEALSIERKAKNKRKKALGKTPLDKRLNVLLPLIEDYPHSKLVY